MAVLTFLTRNWIVFGFTRSKLFYQKQNVHDATVYKDSLCDSGLGLVGTEDLKRYEDANGTGENRQSRKQSPSAIGIPYEI